MVRFSSIVLRVFVVVLSLMVLVSPLEAKSLTITGDPVSSGEFYDVAVHFYTNVLPPLVEARDAEKLRASIPLDGARWKLKDQADKVSNEGGQLNHLRGLFSKSTGNKETWDISTRIETVSMTDATHGAVLWVLINDQADRKGKRQSSRRYASSWEKIDGQWRIVATEHGKTEERPKSR